MTALAAPALLRRLWQGEGKVFVVMTALLVAAPLAGVYPQTLMTCLCMALFACAFNLLIGYVGLLSFGHAMFLGTSAYAAAHAATAWSAGPLVALGFAVVVASALGLVVGWLAIRRQGIYFAMITLGLAQMVFFLCGQATSITHGEDGIQAVPRGTLFGVLDLADDTAMYGFVLAVFLLGFTVIYRIIHSPFGAVLTAIRENEPRATSLGYHTDHYKLIAFVLSAALAGLAGGTKALVSQFAVLDDAKWTMSGHVVLMVLIGGMGRYTGPVVGAFVVVALENYLAKFSGVAPIVEGGVFVLCVLLFREGIMGKLAAWLKTPL
jgi:branched-chain amino acid transport system permease protein